MNHVYHLCKNGRQQNGHREDCRNCNPKAKVGTAPKKKLVKCPKCGMPGEKQFTSPVELKSGRMMQTYIHSSTYEMGFRLIGQHCVVITEKAEVTK